MRRTLLLLFAPCVLAACVAAPSSSPYAPQPAVQRRPAEAEQLTLRAANLTHSDPTEAERLLRDALTNDMFHGPAHNNLGVVFLNRGELYSAASEFEWARKLMPGHPDPRVNLAMTLERAGHSEEALDAYTAALEVMDGYLPALQGLTSLQLKSGKSDENTREYLSEISLRGETPRWRDWARERLESEVP